MAQTFQSTRSVLILKIASGNPLRTSNYKRPLGFQAAVCFGAFCNLCLVNCMTNDIGKTVDIQAASDS